MPRSSGTTDLRARTLRGAATALLLLALLGAWTAAAPAGADAAAPAPAAAASSGPTAAAARADFGAAILAELNRIRARAGLPDVRRDERMSRTAAAHSRDMGRRGYFAHGEWGSRVARASGSAHAVGEVLGWMAHSSPRREARKMVRGWLDSPPHREVLLERDFRRVGLGRATGRLQGLNAAIWTVDWASAR
ncbi:CAP domain-containing protein [Conexibacter sp. JD483]|uniref:CAP domain-containing protein n=1 Tax=unclassified Conexibacter TaxID=2627773 RepID=UPI0027219454|nr:MULTISPECIES: CAP domain-containing protein [unclassified Conexibacter]MDO8187031.1 CAP domain-containing protein [Conexibacter sp. CPCC 205706]MDO8200651.1 CAP domain-containing protein [Conexibacter sp. CPCC 205762]MDR9371251.1 CAP domain-containing protein [Conexibacter sp. JD483]